MFLPQRRLLASWSSSSSSSSSSLCRKLKPSSNFSGQLWKTIFPQEVSSERQLGSTCSSSVVERCSFMLFGAEFLFPQSLDNIHRCWNQTETVSWTSDSGLVSQVTWRLTETTLLYLTRTVLVWVTSHLDLYILRPDRNWNCGLRFDSDSRIDSDFDLTDFELIWTGFGFSFRLILIWFTLIYIYIYIYV